MTVLHVAASVFVGVTTGFLSGLLGMGGGFILVPLLALIGLPIHTAMGTSLASIACIGLAGLTQHARQGSIDLLLACALAIPASFMANLGAHFSSVLAPTLLYLLFSLLTLSVVILFYFHNTAPPPDPDGAIQPAIDRASAYLKHRHRDIAGTRYHYDVHLFKAGVSGLATGLVSGFFGVGGGFMLVPLVVGILHVPMQVTIGTSLAVLIPSAIVGAVTHWHLGHIHVQTWLLVTVSGIASSQLGARYTVKLTSARLKQCFIAVILCGTLYMLIKGLTA